MKKRYLQESVYSALLGRLKYIFEEFDNIFVSFSGGKDSGLLLEMTLDFQKRYYPHKTIGVYHQDFEAQYTVTTEYIERTFKRLEGENAELYWVCLPAATRTALSSYEMYWYPWDDQKEALWVRKMPEHPYVINLKNNPISTYTYRMHQEDLARRFGRWYKMSHGNGKTVCLLGMRAEESLNRYNGFLNKRHDYDGYCWISRQYKDVCTASPMYDWTLSDVWHANYVFDYDYNRLYDMYYKAGLRADQMRVASPFNDYAKDSLNMYRVIDPEIWTRLVGRVNGANFGAIYGKTKALGYRNLTLPEGHTWESYTRFLLDTLPEPLRKNYERIFQTSIDFWHKTGGGLSDGVIEELVERGYNIRTNGVSNYTKSRLKKVVFVGDIPDDTDDVKSTRDIPSWKRMCYCILKNDHNCRFMGFGLTREQQNRIAALKSKYGNLGDDNEL
ncbi:MAG: DUF3440 domain-containing protein [Ruminococcaceae bacterium]|nr:DUF3440 domain-containing protein [Oscillospiraceae bacterium]